MKKEDLWKKISNACLKSENDENEFDKKLKYYATVDVDDERYMDAKQGKMYSEWISMTLKPLEKLPYIHSYRYASNLEMDMFRTGQIRRVNTDLFDINGRISHVSGKISELEFIERDFIKSFSENPDNEQDIKDGKNINAEMKCLNEKLDSLLAARRPIADEREKLKTMTTDEIREMAISHIEKSSELLKLEEDITSKAELYQLFYNAAKDPNMVRELARLITELNDFKKSNKPKRVYLDYNNKLPEDLAKLIYDDPKVCNGNMLLDPEKAREIMNDYWQDFYNQCQVFGKMATVRYMYPIRNLEELARRSEIHAPLGEIYDYFKQDLYDVLLDFYCYDFNDIDDNNVLRKLEELNNKLSLLERQYFVRREKNEVKSERTGVQIHAFSELKQFYIDKFKSFDKLPLVEDEDFFNPSLNCSESDMRLRIERIELAISEREKILRDFIETLVEKIVEKDENDDEYENEIDVFVKKIAILTNCSISDPSILITTCTGDNLLEEIYERAAIVKAANIIKESREAAQDISFETEANIRCISPAKLHRMKMEEQRTIIEAEAEKKYTLQRKNKKKQG